MIDFDMILKSMDPVVELRKNYKIGIVGAGSIVNHCHLPAYKMMRFDVAGITALKGAEELAQKYGISKVYNSVGDLCADPEIDVVDIAVPPEYQLGIAKCAAENHKHILCQKPLAKDYEESKRLVEISKKHGVKLAVNQNCRWAPASRIIKSLLVNGYLGEPIFATIELRVFKNWPEFMADYERLMIRDMSIHHIDVFRYWFGDPKAIYASVMTKCPGTKHIGDYIALYNLEYESGLTAASWDDGFTWSEPDDWSIRIRIEGTGGIVKGTYGWAHDLPDTIEFMSKSNPGYWIKPVIDRKWSPDAFKGTMGDLLMAVDNDREPEINGTDNLKTMALIEAAYKSAAQKRVVNLSEVK